MGRPDEKWLFSPTSSGWVWLSTDFPVREATGLDPTQRVRVRDEPRPTGARPPVAANAGEQVGLGRPARLRTAQFEAPLKTDADLSQKGRPRRAARQGQARWRAAPRRRVALPP